MNNISIQNAINVLKDGGVVVFPTDTAYGIGCRMDSEVAVKKIFEIKQRSAENALLVLVDSVRMAEKYIKIPQDVRKKLVNKYWPGGVSIFLKCRPNKVLGIVTAGTDILAVRNPSHPIMERIIHAVGVPIIATSANLSGGVTPYSLSEVDQEILKHADFVLSGECTFKKESTIIDTTVKPWSIIRMGAVQISI